MRRSHSPSKKTRGCVYEAQTEKDAPGNDDADHLTTVTPFHAQKDIAVLTAPKESVLMRMRT